MSALPFILPAALAVQQRMSLQSILVLRGDLPPHPKVRSRDRNVELISLGFKPERFIEGDRGCPSVTPYDCAAMTRDMVDARPHHRGAKTLATELVTRRHAPKLPAICMRLSWHRRAQHRPRHNRCDAHQLVVDEDPDMEALGFEIAWKYKGLRRLMGTENGVAQHSRFLGRDGANLNSGHTRDPSQEDLFPSWHFLSIQTNKAIWAARNWAVLPISKGHA